MPWVLLRFSNSLKPSLPHCRKTCTNISTKTREHDSHTLRQSCSITSRLCTGPEGPLLRCSGVPCSRFSPSNLELSAWQSSFGHPSTVHLKSSKNTRLEKWKFDLDQLDLLFCGAIQAVWNGSRWVSGLRDFDANLSASTRRQHHLLATRTAYSLTAVSTDLDLFTTCTRLRSTLFKVTLHLRKQKPYGQSWIIRYPGIS